VGRATQTAIITLVDRVFPLACASACSLMRLCAALHFGQGVDMIFVLFKRLVHFSASKTPNAFIPEWGERLTSGKIKKQDWSEYYLATRFVFALLAATILPKSILIVFVMVFVQACSMIYLLKIVFPNGRRELQDPDRSLFFAIGHYLELGLCMSYVYWVVDQLSITNISRLQSAYFSFITMTTVGFGDITPSTDLAKCIVIVHVLVGVFMLATVIGLFLSIASSRQ
jgi:hypothetical protein